MYIWILNYPLQFHMFMTYIYECSTIIPCITVCESVCVYVCACARACVYACVRVHACTCMHVCVWVCVCVCMCACVCVYVWLLDTPFVWLLDIPFPQSVASEKGKKPQFQHRALEKLNFLGIVFMRYENLHFLISTYYGCLFLHTNVWYNFGYASDQNNIHKMNDSNIPSQKPLSFGLSV